MGEDENLHLAWVGRFGCRFSPKTNEEQFTLAFKTDGTKKLLD